MKRKIRLAIIGGGENSWIGHVHRTAARFDDQYEICAGVFSRDPKKSKRFGKKIGISKDRCYSNYRELAQFEKKRKDKAEVVSVMTLPGTHQKIAEFFIKNNFNVISDKAFAANLREAKSLYNAVSKNKKVLYALTHNYSAYSIVRHAKKMIEDNKIGKIEHVNVEYIQDWSKGETIKKSNAKKIFRWKLDKQHVGISTVLNELGTHAYHLMNFITGLQGKSVFADIKQVSREIKMDDNAQILINFENGAKGIFWASTSTKGTIYGLRIRIFGTKGSIEWVQNDPNYLIYTPLNKATRKIERDYNEAGFSKKFTRIKHGHPEGYLSAFANIYKEFASHLRNKNKKSRYFYPTAYEGLLTAKFIDASVRSSKIKRWVNI